MSPAEDTERGSRILVVEDDRAVARGLVHGLRLEGFDVTHAETGADALRQVRATAPQLILLDVRLPDISGFDVCRTLRAEGMRAPIIILTARDEELDKVLGLELGADDYVVKPYGFRELVSRVRALLRRAYGELASPAGQTSIKVGDVELDLVRFAATRRGKPLDLTPTEFRLLRHLAAHPGRAFTRGELIEAVWGYESDIGYDRTVDVHMRHLREKVEPDPASPRHLLTVRGVGYRLA
jgi:DNA-binding response OmpR family regulator